MTYIMLKFRGKKWKDMNLYEKAVFKDIVYKLALPIRVLFFPIALLIKLYKWTYGEE